MPKMHYFSNKFSKITKPLNLQYWWPKVRWFDQIVVFQADCDEKNRYYVIFVTSSPLRRPNDITKITLPNFSILLPPLNQNFWLRHWVKHIKETGIDGNLLWFSFHQPNLSHYTRRITPKRVTSLRCSSSRHSAEATQLLEYMLKR